MHNRQILDPGQNGSCRSIRARLGHSAMGAKVRQTAPKEQRRAFMRCVFFARAL